MFHKPNYTPTPNEFFDDIAKTLKEGELRVLLVIMRQTFGWGNKEWDRISISQLMEKTGMERMAVIRASKSLAEKKLVIKHKEGPEGQEKTWYSLMVENPSEFSNSIEDSNNSYQYPKDTPPSILKIPTKETLTKETISPIVPKGDRPPRKSKREEKIQRATEVWTTQTQHSDLEIRCSTKSITVESCYDKLNTWKIGKEISGGKNDYKAIVDWVIDSVVKNGVSKTLEKERELANKVIEKFPSQVNRNEIQLQDKGILFCYGRIYEFIEFTEFGFRDKIISRLLKMNLDVNNL
jgi:phage replication O-like protein O